MRKGFADVVSAKNLLFTGHPGCGKSTLVEKIAKRIEMPCTGFYTREIREKGRRVGFSIITLGGKEGILAHQAVESGYGIGNYRVNIEDIDQIAVPSMIPQRPDEVVVIDEIGKMECLSGLFRDTLVQALDSSNTVLGTIAMKGDTFVRGIKQRKDVVLIEVQPENRNTLVDIAAAQLIALQHEAR
jgi:nucleoside-triphosphatase THEP1